MSVRRTFLLAPLLLACSTATAGDEPGFVSLFNGKDLTGWRFGKESLDGKGATADGRFKVRDGVLVITGASGPGAPKMEEIDTAATYDRDFVLRLEFRAGR